MPFRAKVEVIKNGRPEAVEFKDVQILAMHPTKDMALAKLDLTQHPGVQLKPVRIVKGKGIPGQRVYAIGNPASAGVTLNRTITSGLLSGIDRRLEGVDYYQISAAVNPGNSGGPLTDRDGNVLGIVTLKMTDSENVGFAIPLFDLNIEEFGPPKRSAVDKVRSDQMQKLASELLKKYGEFERRNEKEKPEAKLLRFIIIQTYAESLMADPTNSRTCYLMGVMFTTEKEWEAAEAFLLEGMEQDPQSGLWPAYRWLGYTMVATKRPDDALIVWHEGLAKNPTGAVQIWDDLAIIHRDRGQWLEAGKHAAMALHLSNQSDAQPRPDLYRAIIALAKSKLSPDEQQKLDQYIAGCATEIAKLQAAATENRRARKAVVTREFGQWIEARNRTVGKKARGTRTQFVKISNTLLPAFVEAGTAGTAPTVGVATTTPSKTMTSNPNSPPPKSATPGKADLLAELDLTRHSVRGDWTLQKGTLTSPNSAKARVEFPNELPQEYDIEFTATRASGNGQFVVGFTREGVQSMIFIDRAGKDSGITGVLPPLLGRTLLKPGQPVPLKIEVRRNGITAYADERVAFKKLTTADYPKVPVDWQVRDRFSLFVGSDLTSIKIEKLTLTTVGK